GGVMMPVLELHSRFLKPSRCDEEITVRTHLKEKPGVKMHFDYEMFNQQGELLNTGSTTLVFVDLQRNKRCAPPRDVIERRQAHVEETTGWIHRFVLTIRPDFHFIEWTEVIVPPGFRAFPLHAVAACSCQAVARESILHNASALAYNFRLANFPGI